MRPTGAATTTSAYGLLENCMLDPLPSAHERRRAVPRRESLPLGGKARSAKGAPIAIAPIIRDTRVLWRGPIGRAIGARPDVFRQSSPSMQPPPSRIAPCPCGSGKRYKECHGAVSAPGLSVPKADDLAAKAQRALAAGRPAEALAHLRQALALTPDSAELLRTSAQGERMNCDNYPPRLCFR